MYSFAKRKGIQLKKQRGREREKKRKREREREKYKADVGNSKRVFVVRLH